MPIKHPIRTTRGQYLTFVSELIIPTRFSIGTTCAGPPKADATVKWQTSAGGPVRGYDAVIVGAGPAGGRAGIELAKAGYAVLFLEKRDVVGVPVQCGEGLSAFGLRNAALPERDAWIRERVKGVRAVLPDGTDFTVTIPGFCIDRALFDQWVVQQAVDTGAELRVRTKVTGVHRHDGGWVVDTDRTESVRCRTLVGADGPASNVARWTGLLLHRFYVKAVEYRFAERDWSYPCDGWLIFYYGQRYRGGYG